MITRGEYTNAADNGMELLWEEWVKKKVEFYIASHKWDNVSITNLNTWLANFNHVGRKWAFALLNHFIYYSELDLRRLCLYALQRVVFQQQLMDVDRNNMFCCSNSLLLQELRERIGETKIVPVLSDENPSESGNAIARLYTTTGLISEKQVISPSEIVNYIKEESSCRLLLVDDFLGSADQVDDFWNKKQFILDGGNRNLSEIHERHRSISFEYIALVATSYGLQRAQSLAPGLKIHFCERLLDEYRVFSDKSIFFRTSAEREECESYLYTLCQQKNIDIRGYHGLDFAIAFHHGTPDSCLPLFWKLSDSWNPLFKHRM